MWFMIVPLTILVFSQNYLAFFELTTFSFEHLFQFQAELKAIVGIELLHDIMLEYFGLVTHEHGDDDDGERDEYEYGA